MKVITFGCRLNSYESALIRELGQEKENTIFINTCAVTHEAERQCAQEIRKQRRLHPDAEIIVAGCAVQLNPEKYLNMKEVDRVLGNYDKIQKENICSEDREIVSDVNKQELEVPLFSSFEHKTRAFLQVQQGCSHACTYCIIPKLRGKNQSIPQERVLEQAELFTKQGYSELNLTGVDLLAYEYGFEELVYRLLHEVDGLKRLRLGSLDPALVSDELMDLFISEKKLMPSVHLSVQSGDNDILRRMGRRHRREHVLHIAEYLRRSLPDVSLGADFITGFPYETEEAFMQTMDLVEKAQIVHLHVFPYSIRPGTPAATMPQVEKHVAKERAERLRQLGDRLLNDFCQSFIGKEMTVLVEEKQNGLTENYLSSHVTCPAEEGTFLTAKVTGVQNGILVF